MELLYIVNCTGGQNVTTVVTPDHEKSLAAVPNCIFQLRLSPITVFQSTTVVLGSSSATVVCGEMTRTSPLLMVLTPLATQLNGNVVHLDTKLKYKLHHDPSPK